MLFLRILLSPFALLYSAVVAVRNFLYQSKVFNRTEFDIPIICVGNLSAGGTGKTPHIEFLLRKLSSHFRLAVLSRGYMRKTTGYIFADKHANASTIGDEPYQIFRKFPEVAVGVSANRVLGVPDLLADAPDTQIILMDDGFQHLAIKAGFNIILTPYNDRFTKDFIIPSGRLREFRSGYKRADVIIVTKCPENISHTEQQKIMEEINPLPNQLVLFSLITYQTKLKSVFSDSEFSLSNLYEVLVFSGIAQAQYFENYIQTQAKKVSSIRYADHHYYSEDDLKTIAERFGFMESATKIIITTEKDAVKLWSHPQKELITSLPLFFISVEVNFVGDGEAQLLKKINQYVNQVNELQDENN
jgi:tetraacyldisaccharide 4'-kinase